MEKEKIPRHKACSEILVPDSINTLSEHFGNVPQDVLAVPSHVNAMRMHFPGGYVGDIPMHVLMIWRDRLDAWLCRTSQAEVLDETKMQSFKCLQLQKGITGSGLERTRDILSESFEVAFDVENMK